MTTYVVTKNIIRRIFEDIATAHKQIKSFGYGDELDYIQKLMNEDTQELASNVIYPRLFVSPTDSVISPGSYARSYVIMVADRIRTGDNNFTEVESDTDLILLDVIAQIQDSDYGFVLDIDNIAVTPFKNKFADMVTGHMATISLVSDWEFDRCQIPQNFIAVTNPYVPFENGSNEQDPLSWHLAGNNLDYEGFLGTTSAQGYSLGTNSVRRWNLELEGNLVPNASGEYDIGSASNPVRTLYVDSIQGNFDIGITSLNGLTDSIQTFEVAISGSIGSAPNIVSASGVHTFRFPLAGTGITNGGISNDAQSIEGVKTFVRNDANNGGQIIVRQEGSGDAVISWHLPNSTNQFYSAGIDNPTRVWSLADGTNLISQPRITVYPAGTVGFGLPVTTTATHKAHIRGALNSGVLLAETSTGGAIINARETAGVRQFGAFGASPVPQQSVTGSRGGNAALASLLTAMANLGWIIDNTTA